MAIKNFVDALQNQRQEYFIHIKRLPCMAYQQDIREFFNGLSVKNEGILIRLHNAFVAFEEAHDLHIAMKRKNKVLLGSEVDLSVISKTELRRFLFRTARRKLNFNEDGIRKKSEDETEIYMRKKIRPTPVIRGKKRKVETSLTFCPKECDLPPPECGKDVAIISWSYNEEYLSYKRKKIHPFRLSDNVDVENFSIFHPEECYEVKNMVFEVS